MEWATANHPEYSLTICIDSQSQLKAIERRSPVTHHLRSFLNARILSNELTDTAAKAGALTTSDLTTDPERVLALARFTLG